MERLEIGTEAVLLGAKNLFDDMFRERKGLSDGLGREVESVVQERRQGVLLIRPQLLHPLVIELRV